MRSRPFLGLLAAFLLGAGSSEAGTLTAATWTTTVQGVVLTVTNAGATCTSTNPAVVGFTPTNCPTAGLGATGSATSTNYNVSLTLPLFQFSQFTTGGAVLIYTHFTLSGAQMISGGVSAATGVPGVAGLLTQKVAVHVKTGADASMYSPARTTLLKIPLSVGKKGELTGYFYVLNSLAYITLDYYAWTPHTLTLTGLTSKGVPLPTVVAMGSVNLTAGGGGTVTLASPTKITTVCALLTERSIRSLTSLKLTFVPEAPTLLLLGAGAAALVLFGRRARS